MTDKTKCQHCGADGDKFGSGILFECGSVNEHQSDLCEVRELRAKVASQQELLKEAATSLRGLVAVSNKSRWPQYDYWDCSQKTQFAEELLTKLDAQS